MQDFFTFRENFEKYFENDSRMSHLDLQAQLNAVQQTAINLSTQVNISNYNFLKSRKQKFNIVIMSEPLTYKVSLDIY